MNLFNGKSYYYVKLKENIKTKLVYIPINGSNNQTIYVQFSNVRDTNNTHVSTIQQTENIYFVKDKEENGYTYFDVHLHAPVLHAPLGSEYRYNYEISRLRLLKDLPSGVSSFNEILSMVDEYLGFDFVDESGQTVSWTMEGTYSNTFDIIQSPKDDSGNTLDINYPVSFPSADVTYNYYIFTNSIRIKVNGINVAPKNIVVKDYWSNAVDPSYFITQIDAKLKLESITRVKNSSRVTHMLTDVYNWKGNVSFDSPDTYIYQDNLNIIWRTKADDSLVQMLDNSAGSAGEFPFEKDSSDYINQITVKFKTNTKTDIQYIFLDGKQSINASLNIFESIKDGQYIEQLTEEDQDGNAVYQVTFNGIKVNTKVAIAYIYVQDHLGNYSDKTAHAINIYNGFITRGTITNSLPLTYQLVSGTTRYENVTQNVQTDPLNDTGSDVLTVFNPKTDVINSQTLFYKVEITHRFSNYIIFGKDINSYHTHDTQWGGDIFRASFNTFIRELTYDPSIKGFIPYYANSSISNFTAIKQGLMFYDSAGKWGSNNKAMYKTATYQPGLQIETVKSNVNGKQFDLSNSIELVEVSLRYEYKSKFTGTYDVDQNILTIPDNSVLYLPIIAYAENADGTGIINGWAVPDVYKVENGKYYLKTVRPQQDSYQYIQVIATNGAIINSQDNLLTGIDQFSIYLADTIITRVDGSHSGTDFHFIDKSITVDSAASEKDVRFYWDGLLTDLSILSFSGFPSTSYITLPTELKDDCIYTLKAKFDQNTGSSKKNYSVTIVKRSDPNIHDSFTAVQDNIIFPDTVFYWEQSSYSIEFYEDYIEAVLHYNDQLGGIPSDKLIITDESTYKDFSLPNVYNEDGIYRIRFNIGPNLDYETKSYTVVLKEKTTRNKQSVRLNIAAKQSPQLFWNPDSLTINHDQESIQVNYYWTNFQGGDPSHFLMMSSDIPGFVPYLPDTVSSNNNYTFVINLGANTGLAPRNYTVTVRSSDKFYSSVLHIMQYGTGGDAYFTYYFEKQNIIAPASGYVPQGYISNKLIGSLTSLTGEFDIISIPYWIKKENIRFDKTSGLLIIDKEDPNIFAERTGKIQILFYSEDGKTYAAEFTVTQEAGQIDSTNISPIWRDTWINIDADYNYFRLVNKNTKEIYFNGQTIKNELAQFKLNNVISDYMNVWGSFGSSLQNGNNFTTSPVEISVSCSKNGSDFDYTLPDTYKFIWDYSYDKHVSGILFNGNIINYYDPRQKIMISSSNRSNNEMITKVETIFSNNDKSTIEEYTLLPGEMHATFVPAYSGPGDGAVKIKVSCTVQGKTEVKEYVPKCTKANYVLHYVNRYGQVCWMLFSGKQIKSDKITSSKFVQAYDNNYRYNFENVVYQNKVEESWQLTTSYLTDKQSNDLTDLYSSPIVFLEDLNADNTDNIIAVTVETKSVDYKNYKNQGKFFTHTIKVQNAQNKFILL